MSRKSISLLLSLVMIATLLLSACQPTTVEVIKTVEVPVEVEKEVITTVEVEKEVTVVETVEVPAEAGSVRIWGFYDLTNTEDSRAVQMKQTIDSFQASTGVKVEYEQVAWDQMATKIALAAQAGGDMPDLIMIGYEYVQGLVNAGALLNIYDQIANSFFYGDLNPFEKTLNEVNGERHAVGTFISGGQWYYDTGMFPNGWPTTEEGWTTECARLAPEGKYVATFYAGRASAAMVQGLAPLVWSLGDTLFDEEGKPTFATDNMVKAITFWRNMLANKCIPEVCFTGDWSATEAPFVEMQAGGVRGGTWSYIYINGLEDRFENGTVKIGDPPALTGGKQGYVFTNTENWALTAGAKNVDNSIKFINFFFNPAVLAPWAKSNFGVPATATALNNAIFDSQFYADTLDNLTRNGHKSETSPYYNECMDALAAKVQELVLNPNMDIMAEMQKLQDELLAQYFQ
jgi:ABC-type glycerol-3-phosphate transport system substrate-binding protein